MLCVFVLQCFKHFRWYSDAAAPKCSEAANTGLQEYYSGTKYLLELRKEMRLSSAPSRVVMSDRHSVHQSTQLPNLLKETESFLWNL